MSAPEQELEQLALRLRDTGTNRAVEDQGARDWLDQATACIEKLASEGYPFTSEDVVRLIGPAPTPAITGAAFLRASRDKRIRCIGIQVATRPSRHGGVVRIWEGTGPEWEP